MYKLLNIPQNFEFKSKYPVISVLCFLKFSWDEFIKMDFLRDATELLNPFSTPFQPPQFNPYISEFNILQFNCQIQNVLFSERNNI